MPTWHVTVRGVQVIPEQLSRVFHEALPTGIDGATVRVIHEREQDLTVRDDVVLPPRLRSDRGAMITVFAEGGSGYAATPDLSLAGLTRAAAQAKAWALRDAQRGLHDRRQVPLSAHKGVYASPVLQDPSAMSLAERFNLLRRICAQTKIDERIVERVASLLFIDTDSLFLSTAGAEIEQRLRHVSPEIVINAHQDGDTQRRSLGGLRGTSQQGGLEVLATFGFSSEALRVARQAIQLVEAENCPTRTTDLLLAPDQMMLQIHESIGHPLELDRILGDERNYAGTSFVQPEMFGSYAYGSPLLNVSFAPDLPTEFASYGFDDEGTPAERVMLIEKGILQAGLGGKLSQARSGIPGTANTRACNWNRPPIDRMANLNVEAGDASFEELVGCIERGIYMETNASWSIDDSRNKFQFGCEYAREIREGQLGPVLKNPNYRGISASFWRSLKGLGDGTTVGLYGTPYCGKGEPNQAVRVGHGSPACLFGDVEVFGGEA